VTPGIPERRFVTVEGIEGSGKTTLLQRMAGHLEQCGHRCRVTREPGGTRLGEQIRTLLLDPRSRDLEPMAELLLYVADRVQHVQQVIRPALADGWTVLCDRYLDATLAYQGYGRGHSLEFIRRLHADAVGAVVPDLTILLDVDPEVGLERAWGQVAAGDRPAAEMRFEAEALAFHQRVRAGYLELARGEPGRFRVVAADGDPQTVWRKVQEMLGP
jgi:dTMP kinase